MAESTPPGLCVSSWMTVLLRRGGEAQKQIAEEGRELDPRLDLVLMLGS